MSIEERVRAALHHHAERIEPADGSRERLQQRIDEARRRRRRGWAAGSMGAVAAAVLLVVAVASLGGDGQVVQTGPAAPPQVTTSTEASVPTSIAPPPPEESAHGFSGIWPFQTQAELIAYLDAGESHYDDAVEVARALAVEFLGMVDPVVRQPTGLGPDGTLDVVVQPRGEAGRVLDPGVLETIVKLDPLGPPWNVLSVTASDIRLDSPAFGREVTSPVTVTGESRAFEGTVEVEVRQDGMEAGDALGQGIVTGGAGPGLGPFSGQVSFDPASTDEGTLVLYTTSAADGSVQQATVVDVSFPAQGMTEVTVFFHRSVEELVPVTRSVPATTGVLRASLEQLLIGPTEAEEAEGLRSLFAPDAAGKLRDVTIDGEGKAVVDFDPWEIGGAGTSAGSISLLQQLQATVFQFPTVASVEYRVEGSCLTFGRYLEAGNCIVAERPSG